MSAQVKVHPEGFWMKSHFYIEGNLLHAVAYSCIAGSPEVFRASLDLRPIMRHVVKVHNRLHQNKISGESVSQALCGPEASIGGIFDDISKPFKSAASSAANAVKKLGKTKLVSAIGSAVKSVVRSKITGGIIAATAVVFPPVGVGAAAAYATANKALDVLEKPKMLVEMGKAAIDKNLPPAARAAAKQALSTASGAILKESASKRFQAPGAKGVMAQAMMIAKQRAAEAKKVIGTVARKARTGDIEAQKYARIINLAHNARSKLQTIARTSAKTPPRLAMKASPPLNGFPALLVTQKGQIVPGRYLEKAGAPKGVVLRGGKVFRGNFAVAGDSDMHDIFGCSNPFTKPAHLR